MDKRPFSAVDAAAAHCHLVTACAELQRAAAAAQAAGLAAVQRRCQGLREQAAQCGRGVMAQMERRREELYGAAEKGE